MSDADKTTRVERDSFGPIEVPAERLWGAQTQRSLGYFAFGDQRMPLAVLHALALIKKAAARVNNRIGDLPPDVARLIRTGRRRSCCTASTTTSFRWWSGRPAAARRAT